MIRIVAGRCLLRWLRRRGEPPPLSDPPDQSGSVAEVDDLMRQGELAKVEALAEELLEEELALLVQQPKARSSTQHSRHGAGPEAVEERHIEWFRSPPSHPCQGRPLARSPQARGLARGGGCGRYRRARAVEELRRASESGELVG